MHLQITANNFDITKKAKSLAQAKIADKLDHHLAPFAANLPPAQIHIEKERFGIYRVNFELHVPKLGRLYAQKRHILLRSAFIDLRQQIEKQIARHRKNN